MRDPKQLTANVVSLWNIIETRQGKRPTDSQKERVYTAASSVSLNSLIDAHVEAVKKLQKMAADAFSKLPANATAEAKRALRQQLFGGNAAALEKALTPLSDMYADSDAFAQRYPGINQDKYWAIHSEVASLYNIAVGGEPEVKRRRGEKALQYLPLPPIAIRASYLGPFSLIMKQAQENVMTQNLVPTTTLTSTYKDNATTEEAARLKASNFTSAYAKLLSVYGTNANDKRLLGLCTALRDALQQIPEAKEIRSIWDSEQNRFVPTETWTKLMNALTAGDVREALNLIYNNNALNAIGSSLQNFHIITVNPTSLTIAKGMAIVTYQFEDNVELFEKFLGGERDRFATKLLEFSFGAFYEFGLVSGLLKSFSVTPTGSAENPVNITRVGTRRLSGNLHAAGLSQAVTLGGTMAKAPFKMVIHATEYLYRDWNLETNVPGPEGVPQKLRVGSTKLADKMALGVLGVDLQFLRRGPHTAEWKTQVSLPRLSVGLVEGRSFYAAMGMDFNYRAGTAMLYHRITPTYMNFAQQSIVGGTITPIGAVWQVSPKLGIATEGNVTVNYNVDTRIVSTSGEGVLQLIMNGASLKFSLGGGSETQARGTPAVEAARRRPWVSGQVTLELVLPDLIPKRRRK
ncbi:MAG: hypothetical protein V1827_00060 [Candidatus Micrarchaeota archaeon]